GGAGGGEAEQHDRSARSDEARQDQEEGGEGEVAGEVAGARAVEADRGDVADRLDQHEGATAEDRGGGVVGAAHDGDREHEADEDDRAALGGEGQREVEDLRREGRKPRGPTTG